MESFALAIIQHRSECGDKRANTASAVGFIAEAARAGADFVLFPEAYLTSYTFPEACFGGQSYAEAERSPEFIRWRDGAIGRDDESLAAVAGAAREYGVGVEITALTRGTKNPRNTAFIIDRRGEIILEYAKVHTCDFSAERFLESGDAFRVCDFDGLRLGTMICYDREYPESARELAMQGAELVLVPNDCGCVRPHRLNELSSEAMQNMICVAMANPPGEQAGSSCAYSPLVWDESGKALDNLVALADEDFDGILYAELDISALRAYRAREDLGKYRKPGAYRHLV